MWVFYGGTAGPQGEVRRRVLAFVTVQKLNPREFIHQEGFFQGQVKSVRLRGGEASQYQQDKRDLPFPGAFWKAVTGEA